MPRGPRRAACPPQRGGENPPEAEEEEEGDEQRHHGDAVTQEVDDDGDLVVHLAFFLQGGDRDVRQRLGAESGDEGGGHVTGCTAAVSPG